MNITKARFIKIWNMKNQTRKKNNKKNKNLVYNYTFRKKKQFNLRNNTIKNL
jgi:hypothetical protein